MAWNYVQNISNSNNCFPCWKKVAVIVAIGFTAHFTVKYYKNRTIRLRRANYKKDVVILHQFGRGKTVPSLSLFCLKLETYLRIANIPYENDFEMPFSHQGKAPWITYNGEDIADSRLCIEFLNRKLNVNLNSNLNDEQVAIDHMIKILLENSTVYGLVLCRWILSTSSVTSSLMNWGPLHFPLLFWYFYRIVRNKQILRLKHQGIGLHKNETVLGFTKDDLRQLSAFLGKKKFLFGEKLSESDITLFSFMTQIIWACPQTELEQWVNEGEFPNLKEHSIRIKELVWPDWDSCLDK